MRCSFPFSATILICADVGMHLMLIFFLFTYVDNDFTSAVAALPLPSPII